MTGARRTGARRTARPTTPLLLAAAALALPASPATPLAAQQGAVEAEAGVSHAQPPSGLDLPSATYGLLGLRLTYGRTGRGWIWGAATAGLASSQDVGDWGALSAGGELWAGEPSGLQAGLGARGAAFTVGAPDGYRAVAGVLSPQVRYLDGPVTYRLRGLGGAGSSRVEITRSGFQTGRIVTDLWYVGAEPGLTVRTGDGRLEAAAAYLDGRGGIYRRAGLRYSARAREVSWSAGLRVWDTPTGSEVSVSASVGIPLGGGWEMSARGGRSDPDPLLESPPSWQGSATVAYRLAELGPPGPVPLYEVRGSGARRTVRVRLRAPEAREVVVLGDFTGWEAVPLERRDGLWVVTLQVEPGVYHFGFRVDGEWFVPEDASGRVTDDWGRTNGTLVVPGT